MKTVGSRRLSTSLHRLQGSLRAKFLLSYLLVVAVGALTVSAAILISGPTLIGHVVDRSHGFSGDAAQTEAARQALVASVVNMMLIAATGASAVAAFAAILTAVAVSRHLTAPIHSLIRSSRLLAAGHYTTRVTVAAQDEVGELAATFNALAETLETTEERRLKLIGDVAHELRTPLATLQGNVEGLLDGVVTPSVTLWTQLLSDAGRMRHLIDDLQELSRAEARQLPIRCMKLDPAPLMSLAVDRFGQQFDDAGITLVLDRPPTLPPVFADPERVTQILSNLLGNALRYTPTGGTVKLSARSQHEEVAFAISDTGIGIAAEHLPHLFERFYRVDRSRSRARGGSGIGLTIARALVEAQQGAINVESLGPGYGATVTFTLPRTAPS